MQHTLKRYTGDWDRISMILREFELATWIRGTVHRLRRHNGEWVLVMSTRRA